VRRDGRDYIVDVPVDYRKINDRLLALADTESQSTPVGMGSVGSRYQRLGWNAAGVEAVASHVAALNQHDPSPELGGTGGRT
jgi:hypothetical protein